MTPKNIEARIKRNQLRLLAGKFYQDFDSDIVVHLNEKGKKALLGIQNNNEIYTLIGEEVVYYSTETGIEKEISHKELLEIFKYNALSLGKKNEFEFVKLNNEDVLWVLNAFTMNAIWNTILFLTSN